MKGSLWLNAHSETSPGETLLQTDPANKPYTLAMILADVGRGRCNLVIFNSGVDEASEFDLPRILLLSRECSQIAQKLIVHSIHVHCSTWLLNNYHLLIIRYWLWALWMLVSPPCVNCC